MKDDERQSTEYCPVWNTTAATARSLNAQGIRQTIEGLQKAMDDLYKLYSAHADWIAFLERSPAAASDTQHTLRCGTKHYHERMKQQYLDDMRALQAAVETQRLVLDALPMLQPRRLHSV